MSSDRTRKLCVVATASTNFFLGDDDATCRAHENTEDTAADRGLSSFFSEDPVARPQHVTYIIPRVMDSFVPRSTN